MTRPVSAAAALIALGALACLGPYPNLGEKLDTGIQVSGTSYLAVDAGAARILIVAPFDGGPAGFTRIDERQPRAVETLQGTYVGSSVNLTFTSTTVFTLPDEHTVPVSRRSGARRQQLSPPEVDEAVVDSSSSESLDLAGASSVAGHYRKLIGRTALITGTEATASACAFHMANLAVESSEARVPGFNSPGMTQYLDRVENFAGILSGNLSVGLVGLFSPVATLTYTDYADFEGVVLDGVQVSSTDSGGNGALSGVLGFRIAREGLPPLDGVVDYRAVSLSNGNESGNYLVTLDGGTEVAVPTGHRIPSLEECFGY